MPPDTDLTQDKAQLDLSQETQDDDQSIVSTDAASTTSRRPSKKEVNQYRRWYYNELNLLDAFEYANSNDLSQNLYGFALEKRTPARVKDVAAKSWASKARWNDDNDAETLRRTHNWAAWPCPRSELPDDVSGFASWEADREEAYSSRRKRRRVGLALHDALSSIGLELVRNQASLSQAGPSPQVHHSIPTETGPSAVSQPPSLSLDEEAAVRLLAPSTNKTVQKLEQFLEMLKPIKQRTPYEHDLLDWSDVLQLAERSRWNTEALNATTTRCSAMFGEAFVSITTQTRGQINRRAVGEENGIKSNHVMGDSAGPSYEF